MEDLMLKKYFPDLVAKSVQDIDLEKLKSINIKGLLVDIDNTLITYSMKEVDEKAINWIKKVNSSELKICLVSNARRKRIERIRKKLNIPAVFSARKPSKKAFLKAIDILEIKAQETAVVGDQIFTDIKGGNRLGMYTILVVPISKKEFFLIKFKRILEIYVLSKHKKHLLKGK
jgi:hypothetical protein